MSAEAFLDANVILYACSSAPADQDKQQTAARLILDEPFALSSQVLQEFIANALKKKALGITEGGIDAMLELAGRVRVLPVSYELVLRAVVVRRRFQLSQWDATIIAAADALGCRKVYSEDMNHGQDYQGVLVINPFL